MKNFIFSIGALLIFSVVGQANDFIFRGSGGRVRIGGACGGVSTYATGGSCGTQTFGYQQTFAAPACGVQTFGYQQTIGIPAYSTYGVGRRRDFFFGNDIFRGGHHHGGVTVVGPHGALRIH